MGRRRGGGIALSGGEGVNIHTDHLFTRKHIAPATNTCEKDPPILQPSL